ncbi:MAG: RNA methyltransferase [Bdellovibrionaceae bacterium]|nr:RNA methyltransferase [Pseudobdellovibrionaceae bacterium]MDW8190297.1 RNA methyltransferase [Pseudobdellovibrionaceae bacterium]
MLFKKHPFILSQIEPSPQLDASWVWSILKGYLTPHRVRKIEEVVSQRRWDVLPVFENLYDSGNLSAALRSAEGLGLCQAVVIQENKRWKLSQRSSSGADKWIEQIRFEQTALAIDFFKKAAIPIVCTTLSDQAYDARSFSWPRPCAIVFGNEHEGVSQSFIAASAYQVHIPMLGFVQSFNISVACALTLWLACHAPDHNPSQWRLNHDDQTYLKALYATKTLTSSDQILFRHWNEQRSNHSKSKPD